MAIKDAKSHLSIECGSISAEITLPYTTVISVHLALARTGKSIDLLAQTLCKKIDEAIQELLTAQQEKTGT